MPYYEHVYIARQDMSQQQTEQLTETFKGVIAEHGGSVSKVEYWGLKTLQHRIKKNRKGHYTLLNVDAPAGAGNAHALIALHTLTVALFDTHVH